MIGYSIDLTQYDHNEFVPENGTYKKLTIDPAKVLPGLLCNPAIGQGSDYSCYELGKIVDQIRDADGGDLVLSESDYGLLVKRIDQIDKQAGLPMLILIRRVKDAPTKNMVAEPAKK